jgi:hypothetical protein
MNKDSLIAAGKLSLVEVKTNEVKPGKWLYEQSKNQFKVFKDDNELDTYLKEQNHGKTI